MTYVRENELKEHAMSLREFGPQTKLLHTLPTKVHKPWKSQLIEWTALDINCEFIGVGSNVGALFLYERTDQNLQRLELKNPDETITCVRMCESVDHLLAAGTSSGYVCIFQIPARIHRKQKQLQLYEVRNVHHSTITALVWSQNGMKLYSGDKDGVVQCTEIDYEKQSSHSYHVHKEAHPVVQLDYIFRLLLISTRFRTLVHNCEENTQKQVGTKDRKTLGNFGAVVLPGKYEHIDKILFASRPGLRLWKASADGKVHTTFVFKDLLQHTSQGLELLGDSLGGCSLNNPSLEEIQFGPLLMYQDTQLVTYNNSSLYVLDPGLGTFVGYHQNIGKINCVAVYNDEIFVLRKEGLRKIIRIAQTPDKFERVLPTPSYGLSSVLGKPPDSLYTGAQKPMELLTQTASTVLGAFKDMSEKMLTNVQEGQRNKLPPWGAYGQQPSVEDAKEPDPSKSPSPDRPIPATTNAPAPKITISNEITNKEDSGRCSQQSHGSSGSESFNKIEDINVVKAPSANEETLQAKMGIITAPDGPGVERFPEIIEHPGGPPVDDEDIVIRLKPRRKAKKKSKGKDKDAISVSSLEILATSMEENIGQNASSMSEALMSQSQTTASEKQVELSTTDSNAPMADKGPSVNTDNFLDDNDPASHINSPLFEVNSPDDFGDELTIFTMGLSYTKKKENKTTDSSRDQDYLASREIETESVNFSALSESNKTDLEMSQKTKPEELTRSQEISNVQGKETKERSTKTTTAMSKHMGQNESTKRTLETNQLTDITFSANSSQEETAISMKTSGDSKNNASKSDTFTDTPLPSVTLDKLKSDVKCEPTLYGTNKDTQLDTCNVEDKHRPIALNVQPQQLHPKSENLIHEHDKSPEPILKDTILKSTGFTNDNDDFYSIYASPTSPVKSPMSIPSDNFGFGMKSKRQPPKSIEDAIDYNTAVQRSQSLNEEEEIAEEGGLCGVLTNAWTEFLVPGNLRCVCVTSRHVWIVDKSDRLYYSHLNGPGLKWHKVDDAPTHQIAVAPSGSIVWRMYRGMLYAGTRVTVQKPFGLKWEDFVQSGVAHISVDENLGWYVKTTGELIMHKNLTRERPCYAPLSVPYDQRLLKVVCLRGVVWVLTEDRTILVRQGVRKGKEEGDSWYCLGSAGPYQLVSDFDLGDEETAWVIDVVGRLWFLTGVTVTRPQGDGQWWQVSLAESLMQDATALGVLKSITEYPQKVLQYLQQNEKVGFVSARCNGIWACPDYKNVLHVCRGGLLGHRWEVLSLPGIAPLITWRHISASALTANDGYIWAQQPSGGMFCFNPCRSARKLQLLEVAPPEPDANVPVQCLSTARDVVWALMPRECNGRVYLRTGIHANCPQGVRWTQLDLSQLRNQTRFIWLSCGTENVWAVDNRGQVHLRIGVHAPSNQLLSPAWVPVEGVPGTIGAKFVKVTAGPNYWMVWALDNSGYVYVRKGVTDSLPVGSHWVYVQGVIASDVIVSESSVYALTSSGEIFIRCDVTEENTMGASWTKIPGVLSCLSAASEGESLWGINKDGQLCTRYTHYLNKRLVLQKLQSNIQKQVSKEDDWEMV